MGEPPDGRVAIVGMGCVFPGAPTAGDLWRNICGGVDAITDVPEGRWDPAYYVPLAPGETPAPHPDRFYCRRGGFVDDLVDFDPTDFGIMPVAVEGAEPDQFIALTQATAALADSGDAHRHVPADRVGVIVGRGAYRSTGSAHLDQRIDTARQLVEALRALLPGLAPERLAQVHDEFVRQLGPARPEAAMGLVPNLCASRIANRFDFQGPAFTVDAACASSLVAVDMGLRELACGRCDLVVAGGTHHSHDVTLWSIFTQLGVLSPSQRIRPFSRQADGILIGEGTGFFVLKRLADAERDDDRVYAVIAGSAVASDGRTGSLVTPHAAGQALALQRAWAAAAFDPATVGLVEAHGTATPAGDETELETLRQVFGKVEGDEARAALGSIKSMIGHAMPAAGAAGLVKAALAVHHGVLPPTLHADDPHPLLEATRFRLIDQTEPWEGGNPRRAGVSAFGFGGINAHLVLEEPRPAGRARRKRTPGESTTTAPGDAPSAAPTTGAADSIDATGATGAAASPTASPALPPILLLAASEPRHLAATLGERVAALDSAAGTDGRHDGWQPSIGDVPGDPGPARLAVVDLTPRRLELAQKVVAQGVPWRGRNGVWFEPSGLVEAGGQIAFLFPGVEPEFDPRVDDVAGHFGLEALLRGAQPPDGGALSALESQARGILAVGRLLHRALGDLGIRPDMIAGHSIGEWTGCIAAGVIADDRLDTLLQRLEPGAIEVADAVFLAVGCGADVAHDLVSGLSGVVVSHDNCPHQSVVCGPPDEIAEVAGRCRDLRVLARELPFRSGFHSPLFEAHLPSLQKAFADLQVAAPRLPLWSATTCRPYPPDPDEVRALATRHLVEPVRFRELVIALHAAGARVFVQLGVGNLPGFVDDTLAGCDALSISAGSAKRAGLDQLARVAAALWVQGCDVALDRLTSPPGEVVRPGRGADADPPPPVVGPHRPGRTPDTDGGDAGDGPAGSGRAPRPLRLGTKIIRTLTPLSAADLPAPADDEPGAASVERRRLGLDTEPAWADHAFFQQRPGWPYPEDRFPVVPLAGIIELLVDAAQALHPGLVAVAVEDVAVFRWLVVEPATEVTVRATTVQSRGGSSATSGAPSGAGRGHDIHGEDREQDEARAPHVPGAAATVRVRTGILGHARATVVLAPTYPAAPKAEVVKLRNERLSPIPADRFYTDRHMFHGPAYQGVRTFLAAGDNGTRAVIESLPAPGALLDNAGQLMGHWLASHAEVDRFVLPRSIERIVFHGPTPPPRTLVDCTVTITHLDGEMLRGDHVLIVDDREWCRIKGWEDRRFNTDPLVFEALRWPERTGMSVDRAGYTLADERWTDPAIRSLVMRRYLSRVERADYERLNPLGQRQFLLGRVAVKDAVRRWLWARDERPLFPAEIAVANDPSGRPLARGPYDADLRVSLAHVEGIAVAQVAEGVDVGVDIERVEPRRPSFEALVLTPGERHLPTPDEHDRDTWLTVLWAAKEAAAKATGRGLNGRPKDFEIVERRGERLRIGDRWIAFERLPPTALPHPRKEHIVAWTVTDH